MLISKGKASSKKRWKGCSQPNEPLGPRPSTTVAKTIILSIRFAWSLMGDIDPIDAAEDPVIHSLRTGGVPV